MKLLFLDFDGVLSRSPEGWSRIEYACVLELNRIIEKTRARIVLSSGWRVKIEQGAISIEGMDLLLRSHGYNGEPLLSWTCPDHQLPSRGAQIKRWLETYPVPATKICALDDQPFDFATCGIPHVVVAGGKGIGAAEADQVIVILNAA